MSDRQPCKHGAVLPRGLVCDRGYLFIRLFTKGRPILREGCGAHNPQTQKLAVIKLNRYREKKFFGKMDAAPDLPSITCSEAFDLYINHAKPSRNITGVIVSRLKPAFGSILYDQLKPAQIIKYREAREKSVDPRTGKQLKFSTVNREQSILQGIYTTIKEWKKIEKDGIPDFKLPEENPCIYVHKPSEEIYARKRVPTDEEMGEAKKWCLTNDPELWSTVIHSIVTMLRKSDLQAVIDNNLTEGIQGKTQKPFKVRTSFPVPKSLTNWRKRWEALQRAMGWNVEGTPTHTVWHDLRHWGPTYLGHVGFGKLIIQQLTGHSTEKMVGRYTHLREEKVNEAVRALEAKLATL